MFKINSKGVGKAINERSLKGKGVTAYVHKRAFKHDNLMFVYKTKPMGKGYIKLRVTIMGENAPRPASAYARMAVTRSKFKEER